MRRHLIEKLANHVADFSRLLPANCKAIYQFCPAAPVIYEELRGELFCDFYYLRHLCDEQRFPDWPIAKPVVFLKACLETWMKEVEKKPENFSVQDACQTLEISVEDLKFCLLCICSELKQYKYAGYYQLIKTIEMETDDENLFQKIVQLLDVCTELCNLTVECSPLNAEQLGREKGLQSLKRAFDRCLPRIGRKSAQNSFETLVSCNILQTFRMSAQFDECLSQISQFSEDFYEELVYIMDFNHLTVLCTVVCKTVTSLCRNQEAQYKLFKSGLLWRLLPLLFSYDFTLDESGVEKTAEQNKQEAVNRLALETLHSCGSLAGFYGNSPENAEIAQFLAKFLTFYICKNIGKVGDDQILKLLNTNSETPYFLWSNVTRAEILNYIEKRQSKKDLEFEDFTFSSYKNELIIGHVFIRIYIQQPSFKIEEPESFCNEIFKYLHSNVKFVDSKAILGENTDLKSMCQILDALFNVINSNSDLEIKCVGHFRLMFGLLTVDQSTSKSCDEKSIIDFYTKVLKLIVRTINNKQCLNDLTSNEKSSPPVSSFLFSTSKFWTPLSLENCQICDLTLTILSTLSSETKIVDELLTNGGCIYLLDLLCNQQLTVDIREKSAQVFCKLTYDKLHGPRWARLICKFLPPAFLDVMRDQPKACVQLFDCKIFAFSKKIS
uniref:Uncharacterized protein n=1 Tax=Romanomermis culicivorax TaxID=13658 RepID=A0A915KD93_ROMCU